MKWLFALTNIKRNKWSITACLAEDLQKANWRTVGDLYKAVRVKAETADEAIHLGLSKIDPDYSLTPKETEGNDPF